MSEADLKQKPDENFTVGEIISCLLKDKVLKESQIKYALRIQSKMVSSKSLLDILKELKYLSDDQLRETLRNNKLSLKIGDLLVELGFIAPEQLQAALKIQQKEKGKKLGEILVERKMIHESEFLDLFSIQIGFPHIDPAFMEIDKRLVSRAPLKWCRKHGFCPVKMENGVPVIVFADPLSDSDIKAAKKMFGEDIIIGVASRNSIESALNKIETGNGNKQVIDENSVQGIVDKIIKTAILDDVSDIHIEPFRNKLQVRFRRDGILVHYKDFPVDIIPMLTSRLKIMSDADITEKRRHQGGRISYEYNGVDFDLRASFYVTIYGEKIVLRVLNKMGQLIDIEHIGMPPRLLKRFLEDALDVPSGVLLVTGPTGSGKTTTVYSSVNYLNKPETSIITAEEPVEYVIDNIGQCSIDPKINLTYEETLRHVVRQDPDVVVIGEIRDNYSADVAVQAALTGHKVLTSFHTEDSISGLVRLMNMDIEAFLVSSTVVCVLAQRLLRRVCKFCGEPWRVTPAELHKIGYGPGEVSKYEFKKGRGCSECRHTGYKGRIAVFEMLVLNEFVRDAILSHKSSFEIRKISMETTGLVTLFEDAVFKAAMGITTLDEVFRCVPRLLPPRPLKEVKRLQGV